MWQRFYEAAAVRGSQRRPTAPRSVVWKGPAGTAQAASYVAGGA